MANSPSYFCDHCGAANQEQAMFCVVCGSLLIVSGPERLLKERYRVREKVGQGGFAFVYKAEDTWYGNRAVAIKDFHLISLPAQEAQEASETFQREVLLLSMLVHPHLPRLYDHFTEAGHCYLVRDFIEGETLEQYLAVRGGSLPLDEVLDIGIQLCTVLDYLHTQRPPIVFRDLKPSNIIRAVTGHIYLIDFGIARHFKPGQVKDTSILGSPGYAAPEQYGRAQTTPQTDIYSLGALLHCLLTGHDPSETPFRFIQPSDHYSSTPEQLRSLLIQLVELDAHKRPSSVALVKHELEQMIARVRPERPRHRVYRDHRGLVLDLAWSPDGTHIISGSSNGALHLWNVTTGHTEGIYIGSDNFALAISLAWSPGGTSIAYGGNNKCVRLWHVVREEDGAMALKPGYLYRGHSNWVTAVAWSPDGAYIASGSDDTTVHVWRVEDIAHSQQAKIYRGHTRWVTAVSWSPDGTAIASGGNDAVVQVWDAATMSTICSYHGHSFGIYALAWSPDGTHIASCSWDHLIQVWGIATGKKVMTYGDHHGAVYTLAWSPDGAYIASAGQDKTVRIWSPITGNTIMVYRGHSGWVYTLAWSPDGTHIASASNDKTVQVWETDMSQ